MAAYECEIITGVRFHCVYAGRTITASSTYTCRDDRRLARSNDSKIAVVSMSAQGTRCYRCRRIKISYTIHDIRPDSRRRCSYIQA